MTALLRPRPIHLAVFLTCAALMAFGLYLQHAEGLEPCPLCILQRYAFVVSGVIALVAAIHGPGRIGAWIYGFLLVLAAGTGAGIAGRQTWLQHNPPKSASCGADLETLIENFPLSQALPKIFAGTGDCAVVTWRFLGLSIAEWSLVWFAIFLAITVWIGFIRRTE